MTPGRLILLGTLVLVAALGVAALARVVAGPKDPSCEAFFCGGAASTALQLVALAVGLYGALLVGIGLARREPLPEDEGKGEER
jgi:hypothetical protein